MAKLDQLLTLVHALAETTEGLTLDDMADRLGVNRRTAERMRDVIAYHFDLIEEPDDRRKRFHIAGSLRRFYTLPTATEIGALQAEVDGLRAAGREDRVGPLAKLLDKMKSAFDDRTKRRLAPDLELLARLQRTMVMAGPMASVAPDAIAAVQTAIMVGQCIEFHYSAENQREPRWRRVIPYGLIHGPLTYVVGKMPGRDDEPVYYRLDRMIEPQVSEQPGCAPADWDLDAWLADSFGVWREDKHDVVLRVKASSAARAKGWRFHRDQQLEELADGGLCIRFSSGGMRELADHLFSWGGELLIEAPDILIETMHERIEAARSMLPQSTSPIVQGSRQTSPSPSL